MFQLVITAYQTTPEYQLYTITNIFFPHLRVCESAQVAELQAAGLSSQAPGCGLGSALFFVYFHPPWTNAYLRSILLMVDGKSTKDQAKLPSTSKYLCSCHVYCPKSTWPKSTSKRQRSMCHLFQRKLWQSHMANGMDVQCVLLPQQGGSDVLEQ